MRFLQALIAFLALPGIVAFVLPAALTWSTAHGQIAHPLGAVPLLPGAAGLLWCARDFYVSGKGTLAPWAPPRHLVVIGLYRFSRNPMYVCVVLILLGWTALMPSAEMVFYTFAVVVAFHLRVVLGEEPWLARTHGDAWTRYAARVRRWL